MKFTQSAATKRQSNRLCISKTAGVNRQSSKHTRHVSGGRREKAGGLFARQNLQSRFRALRGDNPTHPPIEEGGAFGHPSRKCPICQNPIKNGYKYCPECGIRIQDGKPKYEGYSIERLRMLWVQKGGENFYQNFKSIEQLGALPYTKVETIRPNLGDFVNIHFSDLKLMALLAIQPTCAREIEEIQRLLGYYSADYALKTAKLSMLVDIIGRSGVFWNILSNKDIQKAMNDGWTKTNQLVLKLDEVNKKKSTVTYEIEEGQMHYVRANKPMNFIELNILGGQLEAICNRRCIGEEKTKGGKTFFTYQLLAKDDKREYPTTMMEKEDYERLVNEIITYIVENKPSGRKKLKDIVHISGEQATLYFIVKTSEGHRILEKYSGVYVGKKLAEKTKLGNAEETLLYLQKLLRDNRVAIISTPTRTDDTTTIKVIESAYSSGVNNIHMKLDIFLSGLIEGALKQATQQNWTAEETKCIANGDEHCEITCKRA